MENKFHGTDKLGDIVSNFPGASALFQDNRIDFCCGGDRTLNAVIAEHNLEAEPFIEKLNQLYQEADESSKSLINWIEASNSDLIDYVVHKHHAYLGKELPILSELVIKILRVHGEQHGDVLSKLHRLFHSLKMEFDQHLIAEEQSVFPLIKQYEMNPDDTLREKIKTNIITLEADHDGVGDLLKEIRALTDDYTLPEGACNTYQLTFRKLEELEFDTFQHVHLENNVLFPRFI